MATTNKEKTPPKNDIKYSITLSDEQKQAKAKIIETPFNFLLGQAGSGKTLLAVQIALDMFFKRQVNKIIITRPTVSNEDNGFLPGSLAEKMDPWLVPLRSNMRKVYNKPEILDKMEKEENIELVSLAHFRGRTFDNAICIVDEFQNLTKQQLQMVLSRLGKDSLMILTGDKHQIDLKFKNDSAIHDVPKIKGSKFVNEIILKDNHRHEALTEILRLLNESY
ncbi:PhoH Phosphate starvation-inducible protein PhoH, predicted ATPase [uncultured Caudovirales phage]|jgi:phosphate starvation-inducible PhoH-like protein|uniref:PhoH Phosphate starvation-inducible protein PhoH, predicted ATPase n=1 Tax=uncultured Caudovirales phage TaxID=2100421 RepID=A0A6J5NTR7_9CAUD|nr:PhoH Phosphate starvation-inducible protein PhoH, predicted ATPase [uncultured Caudovirales phage]